VALVQGTFDLPRGTVDAPIGRDPHRPRRRALVPTGRHAVTHYRMVRQWDSPGVALLSVSSRRAHPPDPGAPGRDRPSVIGDRCTAGGDPIVAPRLFLHAESLRFVHPDPVRR
jgi:23S rRNA pseudouridine1911/1915/1917 synthase